MNKFKVGESVVLYSATPKLYNGAHGKIFAILGDDLYDVDIWDKDNEHKVRIPVHGKYLVKVISL